MFNASRQTGARKVAHPTLTNRFYLLCRDFALLGPKSAIRHNALKIWRHAQSASPGFARHDVDHRFAIETANQGVPNDLCITSANRKLGCAYAPTRDGLFRTMLDEVHVDFSNYVFVDIGAGKGKILLAASDYPFKKIIGVEYSETLAIIARENISSHSTRAQRCRDITCLCVDAADFDLPLTPLIIYLFNPFQGKVMDRVIRNIEASLEKQGRDVWVIYLTPWEDRKFRRSNKLRMVKSTWDFSIYRSCSNE